MSNISDAARARQEAAREANGQFGVQPHDRADDVQLASPEVNKNGLDVQTLQRLNEIGMRRRGPMSAEDAREYADVSGLQANKTIASLAESKYPIDFEDIGDGELTADVAVKDTYLKVRADGESEDLIIDFGGEDLGLIGGDSNIKVEDITVPYDAVYCGAYVNIGLAASYYHPYSLDCEYRHLVNVDGTPAQRLDQALDAITNNDTQYDLYDDMMDFLRRDY